MKLYTPLFGLSLIAALVAQNPPMYGGVGSRYGQQIGAIEANSLLTPTGSVAVAASGSDRRIYVRFLASSARNVTGYDLFMRCTTGALVTPAYLYDAGTASQ